MKREYGGIDIFRIVASILVIAIHTFTINKSLDFIFSRVIARVAVPFFFMISGFFVLKNPTKDNLFKFIKKTSFYYLVSIIIYLPLNIYSGQIKEWTNIFIFIKRILFEGTFYHLWYLPAMILGILISYFIIKLKDNKMILLIVSFLYLIGLFGDSYYNIILKVPIINYFYYIIFLFSEQTRNGLFFAPMFIILGYFISNRKTDKNTNFYLISFLISMMLMIVEGVLLHYFDVQRYDTMYFFLVPSMYFLFSYLLSLEAKSSKKLREISLIVYIVHPWIIVILRGIASFLDLQHLLVQNQLIQFLSIIICSYIFALIFFQIKNIRGND